MFVSMSTSPKPARYSNKRDHILRMPLERTIDECVKNGDDVKLMVEKILLTLGEQNLINYGDLSVTSLLTPAGRVLSLLIQKPFLTIREMSVLLGTSETNVMKAVAKLLDDDLIARTKVKGRNEYEIVITKVENHSDIRGLFAVIKRLLSK